MRGWAGFCFGGDHSPRNIHFGGNDGVDAGSGLTALPSGAAGGAIGCSGGGTTGLGAIFAGLARSSSPTRHADLRRCIRPGSGVAKRTPLFFEAIAEKHSSKALSLPQAVAAGCKERRIMPLGSVLRHEPSVETVICCSPRRLRLHY